MLSTSYPLKSESLLTSFEVPVNFDSRFGHIVSGYFIPPATGRYRFFLACNERCELDFDSNYYDVTAPAEPVFTKVAELTSEVDFRHFALPDEAYPTTGLTSFT